MAEKRKTADQAEDQDFREEAERLALASKADQKAIIALHRSVAADNGVSKANRDVARRRADALEKHLGRARKEKKKRI